MDEEFMDPLDQQETNRKVDEQKEEEEDEQMNANQLDK